MWIKKKYTSIYITSAKIMESSCNFYFFWLEVHFGNFQLKKNHIASSSCKLHTYSHSHNIYLPFWHLLLLKYSQKWKKRDFAEWKQTWQPNNSTSCFNFTIPFPKSGIFIKNMQKCVYCDNQHQKLTIEPNFQSDQTQHPSYPLTPLKVIYWKQICQIFIYHDHQYPHITLKPNFQWDQTIYSW